MDNDAYYHKTVTYRAWKRELKFQTSQELFSAHDIDTGTKFLLRTIVEAGYPPSEAILDMGCGYGPLGLTLKSLYPESAVHMTDRDALAVDYARRNAALNNLDLEAYGSLGYDDVTHHDFNLIVSNIPGKAGEQVIAYILREAQFYLKPEGRAAVVVVSPLEDFVKKVLDETPDVEILLKRARSGHTVFHYRFNQSIPEPEESAIERGIYHREDITIRFDGLQYNMRTAYGLPEFDSLSYDTEILLKALTGYKNKEISGALVLNPGQGHMPVVLWQYFHPQNISLSDRDLLALRYSELNLEKNGCPAENINLFHRVGPDAGQEKLDLIAGVLREEPVEAIKKIIDKAADLLAGKGMLVLSGSSTAITRLATYVESKAVFNIKGRERRRGYSALALEKLDTGRKKR